MNRKKDSVEKAVQNQHLKNFKFLRESNLIEGEEWEDLPLAALQYAFSLVHKDITPEAIKDLHRLHREPCAKFHGGTEHIRFGEWRRGIVRVASWVAPHPLQVDRLMDEYCEDWKQMSAWQAHVRFEHIHPFEDLNGRVGRLLWLVKAIEEGYDYDISFLHSFYYDTLKRSQ